MGIAMQVTQHDALLPTALELAQRTPVNRLKQRLTKFDENGATYGAGKTLDLARVCGCAITA